MGDFGAIFRKEAWAIVRGNFQKLADFKKWSELENLSSESAQTFYITLGHQYVSENVIKILGDFGAIFWKKALAIVLGNFQKLADFLKWP